MTSTRATTKLFQGNKVRRIWDEKNELWYFSVIDVVEILSGSATPKRYWSDLKIKLRDEGAVQTYDKIVRLELVLNMSGETSSTEISKKVKPKTFKENRKVAKEGGGVARVARKNLEKRLGRTVIVGRKMLQQD